MPKKYLMGFDLGTDSVGWCVTDECGHIVKKQGKRLWGVNLFSESGDCKVRRVNRIARRRTKRRKERISLLQSLMKSEICKVDPCFLLRLNSSFLHKEDKPEELQMEDGTLFSGVGGLTDEDFYKNEGKTIYHLRKHLMEADEKADIRELYLALHHMIKYRGNFLQSGNWSSDNTDGFVESFETINNCLEELGVNTKFTISSEIVKDLVSRVNAAKTKSLKEEILRENLKADGGYAKLITKMIVGFKTPVKNLYDSFLDDEDNIAEVKSIEFGSASIDDDLAKLDAVVGDRKETSLIKASKSINDYLKLRDLLGDNKYLSDAMVEIYDRHQKDLKELKDYIKHIPDAAESKKIYDSTFREYDKKVNNYSHYVGMVSTNGVRRRTPHCKQIEFYSFLKEKVFANADKNDPYVKSVFERMEGLKYMPKQNDSGNGIYPYQLNEMEMQIILEKQSKYYDFLNVSDEYGSVKDKILSLLTFKIPYYVGPLMAEKEGDPRSSHSWVVFKENRAKVITPWNFKDSVDEDASSEKFIRRMLNKCSYIEGEDALPKNSLLYSEFEIVEFLTRIQINGKPLENKSFGNDDITMDEMIDFFKTHKSQITEMKKYIKQKTGRSDDPIITFRTKNSEVRAEDMPNTMAAYNDFAKIFGAEYLKNENNSEVIEEIIVDLSVFPERDIVEKRLRARNCFTEEQIRRIRSLNYSGFGRLSKAFLKMQSKYLDNNTGEILEISLIDAMKKYGMNHIALINDAPSSEGVRFEFKRTLEELNGGETKLVGDDFDSKINNFVSSLYMAPQMKRPVIRAYKIIKEVEKILGNDISEFYVECTRKVGKKERTKSRYQYLIELYKDAKAKCESEFKQDFDSAVKGLERWKEKQDSLRSDKLFLYFTQLGRDAYTGEPIDISLLDDPKALDIDHIIPQSLRKDDSLDNRVLVYQETNRRKSDLYPLPDGFVSKEAKAFLRHLLKLKLISETKYNAILRSANSPLSDDEIFDFTNRQLTVTNQAIIALKKTIQAFAENSEKAPKIILSRANTISEFRHRYKLIKCREINDFHHAHDAYLNIVVGKTIASYFGMDRSDPKSWLAHLREKHYTTNTKKLFENPNGNKPPISDYQGNIIWNYEESIKEIKENIFKHFDVMTTVTPTVEKGLFKVSIHPASDDKEGNLTPTKKNLDTSKYGGFNDLKNGFASLAVLKDKKGNLEYKLVFIPNIYANHRDLLLIENYIKSIFGKNFVKVELPVVRIGSIFRINRSDVYLSGKTGNNAIVRAARQAYFSEDLIRTLNVVTKVITKLSQSKIAFNKDFDLDFALKKTGMVLKDELLIASVVSDDSKTVSSFELLEGYDALAASLGGKTMQAYTASRTLSTKLMDDQWRNSFANLDNVRKCIVLSEMLKIVKGNSSEAANLVLVGGPSETSKRVVSTNMPEHFEIIAKSITGFYCKTLFKI